MATKWQLFVAEDEWKSLTCSVTDFETEPVVSVSLGSTLLKSSLILQTQGCPATSNDGWLRQFHNLSRNLGSQVFPLFSETCSATHLPFTSIHQSWPLVNQDIVAEHGPFIDIWWFPYGKCLGFMVKAAKWLKSSAQHLSMRCCGLGAPGSAGKRSSAMALPENLSWAVVPVGNSLCTWGSIMIYLQLSVYLPKYSTFTMFTCSLNLICT